MVELYIYIYVIRHNQTILYKLRPSYLNCYASLARPLNCFILGSRWGNPGGGISGSAMGKKRKKSSSSSEVENRCGEVGGQRCSHHTHRYIHQICHTCILYTTARIDTHTHTHTYTLFFLWWGWCQHISCNSWFTHSVCLGQSEASEASEKKQKKASAPKAKAAGGHPKLFAALHRVYLF